MPLLPLLQPLAADLWKLLIGCLHEVSERLQAVYRFPCKLITIRHVNRISAGRDRLSPFSIYGPLGTCLEKIESGTSQIYNLQEHAGVGVCACIVQPIVS